MELETTGGLRSANRKDGHFVFGGKEMRMKGGGVRRGVRESLARRVLRDMYRRGGTCADACYMKLRDLKCEYKLRLVFAG